MAKMAVGPVSVALLLGVLFTLTVGEPLLFLKDSGHATNCGPVPFNLTWTPKDVDSPNPLTVYIDFTAPHDFDGGFLNTSVYFHGDSVPFLGYADNVDCQDVNRFSPFKICPIKKGLHVKTFKKITDLHSVSSFPGTYDAIARLNNKQGQEMLCIKLTLTILPPHY